MQTSRNQIFMLLFDIIPICFAVVAIWYTMRPGEIFGKLGDWLGQNLPEKIHSPVFSCPVCMFPWYGVPLYIVLQTFVYDQPMNWRELVIVVPTGLGINVLLSAAINYFFDNREPNDWERVS